MCFAYFQYKVFLHNLLFDAETFTSVSLFQNITPTNVRWSCRFIASLEKHLFSYSFYSCGIYIFVQSDGSFIFSFGFSIEEVSTCRFQKTVDGTSVKCIPWLEKYLVRPKTIRFLCKF